ncbi:MULTISPECIES: TauD/TfdA family dioxygenase [unclassified Streptomyces]|uniref:TauD/TfdA family dioxygenase n=1 Tax=unclassified Streptomyces TaxID=2593676 RepID=UPI002DD97596|nr:TauD/TfdA family dioxygenase [Streptomyces sp. NBC_01751]WSD24837.1 TauD/TfdA family dioxygenase [Streptomyces sp. NBC_01751]
MTAGPGTARFGLDDGLRDVLAKEVHERIECAEPLAPDTHGAILARIGGHVLERHLPGRVVDGLREFTGSGAPALIIENLPRPEVPPTPVDGFCEEPPLAVINALHLGLVRLLGGVPFAVEYENRGLLMRNVVPNPAAAGTTSSWGADAEFFWHSDNPHLPFGEPGYDPRPFVPRHLAFYAVRNQERVPTEVVPVGEVLSGLDLETRRDLTRPEFEIGPPASTGADAPGPLRDVAVLEAGPDGRPRIRYDQGTTRGGTARAAAALIRLAEAFENTAAERFALEPGGFLVFDNYRVLHRRRAFVPGPPVTARWLRRCYAG